MPGQKFAWTQARHRGRDRHDANIEFALRKMIERCQSLRDQIGVRREVVVSQRLPIGQAMHAQQRRKKSDFSR